MLGDLFLNVLPVLMICGIYFLVDIQSVSFAATETITSELELACQEYTIFGDYASGARKLHAAKKSSYFFTKSLFVSYKPRRR